MKIQTKLKWIKMAKNNDSKIDTVKECGSCFGEGWEYVTGPDGESEKEPCKKCGGSAKGAA